MRLMGAPAAEALYREMEAALERRKSRTLLVFRQEGEAASRSYLTMIRRSCEAHGVPLLEADMENMDALTAPEIGGAIAISRGEISIPPSLDVDGCGQAAFAALCTGEGFSFNTPCTAEGCIRLLDHYGIQLAGRHAVILGRSVRVGKPLALLLLQRDATVTVCHSHSRALPELCRQGDILICAAGAPGLVDASFVRPGQTVINVGGDADEEAVEPVVAHLAPFKGGVGPVTTAVLLRHVNRL